MPLKHHVNCTKLCKQVSPESSYDLGTEYTVKMTDNMSEKARVRHTAVYSSTDRQTDSQ